jgi:hypothetical protein
MKHVIRIITAVLVFAAAGSAFTVQARAADAVYPNGARVGLVPMAGLAPATDFVGFVSADQKVKVGITELPEAAYTAIDSALKEGKAPPQGPQVQPFETPTRKGYFAIESGKEGASEVTTYSLILPGDKFAGYVIAQVRDGADGDFSEAAIRKMFATTVLRSEVPVEEQLRLLSFKIDDLAGFKTVRTIAPRSAVLLVDGDANATLDSTPYMMIGLLQGNPAQPEDRGRFAEQVATTIPGLRNARITSNEPMRIEGTPGYETRIEAVSGKNDTPVMIVQWLRFGGNNAVMRIVGSTPKDEWSKTFPRFRAVRDGIGAR